MTPHDKLSKGLRFIASGGMAAEDPDVVADLLRQAHALAIAVNSDAGASTATKEAADALLQQLDADTYDGG